MIIQVPRVTRNPPVCTRQYTQSNWCYLISFFNHFLSFLSTHFPFHSFIFCPLLTYIVPLLMTFMCVCGIPRSIHSIRAIDPALWLDVITQKLIGDAIHLRRTESPRPSRNTRRATAVAMETVAVALPFFVEDAKPSLLRISIWRQRQQNNQVVFFSQSDFFPLHPPAENGALLQRSYSVTCNGTGYEASFIHHQQTKHMESCIIKSNKKKHKRWWKKNTFPLFLFVLFVFFN